MTDYEQLWKDLKKVLEGHLDNSKDLKRKEHGTMGEAFLNGCIYEIKTILNVMETGEIENA